MIPGQEPINQRGRRTPALVRGPGSVRTSHEIRSVKNGSDRTRSITSSALARHLRWDAAAVYGGSVSGQSLHGSTGELVQSRKRPDTRRMNIRFKDRQSLAISRTTDIYALVFSGLEAAAKVREARSASRALSVPALGDRSTAKSTETAANDCSRHISWHSPLGRKNSLSFEVEPGPFEPPASLLQARGNLIAPMFGLLHFLKNAVEVVGLRRLHRREFLYDISSFSQSSWPMGRMFQS